MYLILSFALTVSYCVTFPSLSKTSAFFVTVILFEFTFTSGVETFNVSGVHLTACDSHGSSTVILSITVVASVLSPAFAAPAFPAFAPAPPALPALAFPPFAFPFAALLPAAPSFAAAPSPAFPFALPLLSPFVASPAFAPFPLLAPSLLLSPAFGFVPGVFG